ncbi:Oidioi.mRNA.OKI2018_I69.chr1.g2939.t1.cds [Oikopleura dioica]|uniref:Oidioi.mRNA.OKI2018_I69.chr1.g2939.t1.cds n=1 Tax=Oikopleura dioica TaxID=34765 RepID=A0ABN7SY29_OIKDI|nr:Oidioi.mRNA.OKI2018_I69.chr1.g2939.t1.cds [Oikopleura dioica]
MAIHLRVCPAMNVPCSHFWKRTQVSHLDEAPGKFIPNHSILDSNLDLSAALFDQHNVFSNILPLRFFEKQKFQPKKKFVKIRNEYKLIAKALVDAAVEAALMIMKAPEQTKANYDFG